MKDVIDDRQRGSIKNDITIREALKRGLPTQCPRANQTENGVDSARALTSILSVKIGKKQKG